MVKSMKKISRNEFFLVFLFTAIMSVVFLFPLFPYFFTGIPYTHHPVKGFEVVSNFQGDHFQFLYHLALFGKAVSGKIPFLTAGYQFSTPYSSTNMATYFPPQGPLFFLFSFLGYAGAYNILIVLSFFVAMLSGYYFLKQLGLGPYGAFSGAMIFCFFPYRLTSLIGGHPAGMMIAYIPLFLWLFDRAFTRASFWASTGAGIILMMFTFSEPHYLYFLFLFIPFYFVYIVLRENVALYAGVRKKPLSGLFLFIRKKIFAGIRYTFKVLRFSWPILVMMIICVAYMVQIKKASLDASAIGSGRNLAEVSLFAPQLSDIFKPVNENGARYVYPGLPAVVFSALALALWLFSLARKKEWEKRDISMAFFGAVFVISFILAFGPNIKMPPFFLLCRKFIPFFNFIRSPIKVIVFSALALAFLAGTGVSMLEKKRVPGFILPVLLLAEYVLIFGMGICVIDSRNTVLTELREAESKGKVMYLPIWPGDSSWESLYQMFSLYTDRYMINGYQPVVPRGYIQNVCGPLYPLNFGRISRKEWELVRELGVTDIVFHKEAFPRKVSPFPQRLTFLNLKSSPYLEYKGYDDPLYHFSVRESFPAGEQPDILPEGSASAFGFTMEGEQFAVRQGNVTKIRDENAYAGGAIVLSGQDEARILGRKYFPDGSYNGFIRLKIEDSDENMDLRWRILMPDNEEVLNKKISCPLDLEADADGYISVPFAFRLKKTARLSFVLSRQGNGTVFFDYFYCKFSSESDPLYDISPADGIFIGRLVEGDDGAAMVYVDENEYPPGPAAFAPNRFYEKGSYSAQFSLRGEFSGNSAKEVVSLKVTDAYGGQIFSEKKLTAKDFSRKGGDFFSVPFDLKRGRVLNFTVHFEGQGKLWVRKIRIQRKGKS